MRIKTLFSEFWTFGLKQAYACLFGGFLLAVMIGTHYWYPFSALHRYDFIFLSAIAFQVFLLALKLEILRESVVILVFHVVATVMVSLSKLSYWYLLMLLSFVLVSLISDVKPHNLKAAQPAIE